MKKAIIANIRVVAVDTPNIIAVVELIVVVEKPILFPKYPD